MVGILATGDVIDVQCTACMRMQNCRTSDRSTSTLVFAGQSYAHVDAHATVVVEQLDLTSIVTALRCTTHDINFACSYNIIIIHAAC